MSNTHKENFDSFPMILAMLKGAKEQGIAKTSQYRLFIKLKDKSIEKAVYPNSTLISLILSKAFVGISDNITDQQLDEMSGLAIELFNDTYNILLKDFSNDLPLVNKLFMELVRNTK